MKTKLHPQQKSLGPYSDGSEVHAAPGPAWHGQALLLRQLGDHGLGRDEQAGDRGRTLQRRAHHFGRVDDALRDEIAVLARLRVIAVGVGVLLQDLADHDRAVFAGIDGDLARGPGDRASLARSSATPPPGRMTSSTAARVACMASSTRSLRSLTSISVAPPTRSTAPPPASLASRSWSFSRS